MSAESKDHARKLANEMLDNLIPNEELRERIKADAATLDRIHDARANGFYFICTMTWKDDQTLKAHTEFSLPVDPELATQIHDVLLTEAHKCSVKAVQSETRERN